jgi:hypothetical protein
VLKKDVTEMVPKIMKEKYDDIAELIVKFCDERLKSEEYKETSLKLCEKLSAKRPSPLLSGKVNTWAASIVHAIGYVNFLHDKSQDVYISPADLADWFGLAATTVSSKSKDIRTLMKINRLDPKWTLRSKMDSNPMAWLVSFNGVPLDARSLPLEVQKEAFRKGLIPYVPSQEQKP